MNSRSRHQKYMFIILFLIMAGIFLLMIKPFLVAIIMAVIASHVFHPLYLNLKKKMKHENLAAVVACLIVLIVIIIPLFFTINSLVKEAGTVLSIVKEKSVGQEIVTFINDCDWFLCQNIPKAEIENVGNTIVERGLSFIIARGPLVIKTITDTVLGLFIFFLALFFLFRDYEKIRKRTMNLFPLKKTYKKKISKKFDETTYGIISGSLIIALIQGVVGGVGFWIFNLQSPVLWGVIMAILSFIPIIGPAIIWVPTGIILLFINPLKGIGFIIYSAALLGSIDNILKPKIIGTKSKVHPLLVFLSIVGGIGYFGWSGVVLGPFVAALLITLLHIYELDMEKG